MEQACRKRAARDQGRCLSRCALGACLCPCLHRRPPCPEPRFAAPLVPDRKGRARMGRALRPWPRRLRPRPHSYPHRPGAERAGRGLGPGGRAEGAGLHRRPRPDRGECAADRKTAWPRRADEPHALSSPLRPSGQRPAGHAYSLARRGGADERRNLRCFGARGAFLAAHARALPGDRAGAKLDRGVS